jgi:hypothetical protein
MDPLPQPIANGESIRSTLLQRMFDYWQSKLRGRRWPDRADIDPTEIPKLLPNIVLVDILPNRLDCFRYRLVGTEIVRAFGRDMTGRTTDDIPNPDLKKRAVESFAACREAAMPMSQEWLRPWTGVQDYERIMLPLTRGSDEVAMILLGIDILVAATAPRPFAPA